MNTSNFIKYTLANSELLSKVVDVCKTLLNSSSLAESTQNYVDSRICLNAKNKFDFGYFPDENNLHLLIDKVGYPALKRLGLVYPDKDNPILMKGSLSNHNLIMPIKDEYGHIVALIGRSLFSDEEQKKLEIQKYKYTNRYKKSTNLFGIYYAKKAIRNSNSVILVEGQIDCISCHSNGLHNTVALGGSSMSDYQLYSLMKYSKDLKINLLLDNDNAGRKGQQKIIDRFSNKVKINKVSLPTEYKDIDAYLRNSKNHNILNELF